MARLAINEELNGIEIMFDGKPAAETLEALKDAGFRWHRAKKLWYAKNNAERLTLAQSITDGQPTQAAPAKVAKVDKINLDNLGANKPASLYGAELAKAIREDLKRRGVSGVTVRARKITYDTGITVTVKAKPEDFTSLEEMKERFSFYDFATLATRHGVYTGEKWIYNLDELSQAEKLEAYDKYIEYNAHKAPQVNIHYLDGHRNDYNTITTAFYNKIVAVFKIANQWNYDHSDTMSDYFDVGYYLDIDVKMPEGFEVREEMTEAEREALTAERKAEEEARQAAFEKWQKEQEESRKRYEEAERICKQRRETTIKGSTVRDLDENEQIYITNLIGGIGKESDIDELNETIESGHALREDAQIVRRVDMTPEAFEAFCHNLLDDYEFIAGMGGTGSDDVRLEKIKNLYELNEEQRENVKWYICKAVAIYCNNELKLVCDPQGFGYSRYTYKPTEESRTASATETAERQKAESETKPAFYFPQPVDDQVKNIQAGEKITVYKCDGWMLQSIYAGFGTVAEIAPATWAQYTGQKITFTSGKSVFIRDNNKCLIYKGIKPALPDTVTRQQISKNCYMMHNADQLFENAYMYYLKQGEKPILNTIQGFDRSEDVESYRKVV